LACAPNLTASNTFEFAPLRKKIRSPPELNENSSWFWSNEMNPRGGRTVFGGMVNLFVLRASLRKQPEMSSY
jgi:hypothetical protein